MKKTTELTFENSCAAHLVRCTWQELRVLPANGASNVCAATVPSRTQTRAWSAQGSLGRRLKFEARRQRQQSTAEWFEQIELQAKLLKYFLGSNKSNINQRRCTGHPGGGATKSAVNSFHIFQSVCFLLTLIWWQAIFFFVLFEHLLPPFCCCCCLNGPGSAIQCNAARN